jgi:hypothetical protein
MDSRAAVSPGARLPHLAALAHGSLGIAGAESDGDQALGRFAFDAPQQRCEKPYDIVPTNGGPTIYIG